MEPLSVTKAQGVGIEREAEAMDERQRSGLSGTVDRGGGMSRPRKGTRRYGWHPSYLVTYARGGKKSGPR